MNSGPLYFDFLRRMVQEHCGVLLGPDKEYLMASVLEPALEEWGIGSMADLMARLWQEKNGPLSRKVVEALVPAETYFFRDPSFYETLEKLVIPEMVQKRSKERRLRLWSVACSTGQEPYSLALLIKDKFPFLFQWDLSLLASDFSRTSLEKARRGLYSALEVKRGLPEEYLPKYFHRKDAGWQINDDIRGAVQFQEGNLMDARMTHAPVDILLLRNVLIYFEEGVRKQVLTRLERLLRPDGYLFLGASESTLFLNEGLKAVSLGGRTAGYRTRR